MLTVNGTAVQRHQVMGPVGYTVVGNPTIVDGVASGFSGSDYLFINGNAVNGFEVGMKFTTASITKRQQYLWAQSETGGVQILENGSMKFSVNSDHSPSAESALTYVLSPYTSYKFIATKLGNTLSLTLYDEYGTMLDMATSTKSAYVNMTSYIGVLYSYRQYPFFGSIDLNETYIKVNGKLWFYQPQETKYIVKDGKLVWADPRLALSGPVNYEVVGSPTITDGVASGFDGKTNYITTSSTFTSANSFETVIKIKFSALPDYRKYIFSKDGTLALLLRSNGNLAFHYGDYINGWITNNPNSIGTTILSIDTDYWVKLVYTGTTITLYLSTDGITYIQECSVSTTLFISSYAFNMGYSYSSTNTAFSTGSIDLNETYIKINDQLWFYGKNYATQNIAPVPAGYTYGNTTTPSIGYVDMRTQQFTAAPSGATIGRDE